MSVDHGGGFDRLLESAVVASWSDFMRGAPIGSVHVEYDFTANGALEYLQKAVTLPRNFGRAGFLQIATPTEKESAAAAVSMNEAFDYINCAHWSWALA
jgi:hypothetical protein